MASFARATRRGKPQGPAVDADATIVEGTSEVEALLAQKYRRVWPAYTRATAAFRRLMHQEEPESVTIRITPRAGESVLPVPPSAPAEPSGSWTLRVSDAIRLFGVVIAGVWTGRPIHPLFGETARSFSGDDLVPHAKLVWQHGITIDAPPSKIWPWLIQMGCRRGGWYSYDGLDNGGLPSAERIVPVLQHVQADEIFPMSPTQHDTFVVRMVEPERALVLGDAAGGMSWAFVLEPLDQERTRLVSRVRATYDNPALALLFKVFWRPVHFAMQRKQLLNLKLLVETATTAPIAETPVERDRVTTSR